MSDYLSLSLELNRVELELKETREKLDRAIRVIEYYFLQDDSGEMAWQFLKTIMEQE